MKLKFFLIVVVLLLNNCSKVRESAGVTRKSIDEFQVIQNPPLIIPPDFNILPPDQLVQKNLNNIEKELAEEILFGLDENIEENQTELSTINQILEQSEALEISDSIRGEIDEQYSKEIKTKKIINFKFENEDEILDAIKESERLRNIKFGKEVVVEEKILTEVNETKPKKKKKKKRFIFF